MRRALLVLVCLPLAYFGVRAVVYALVSDTTQIRWRIEDAVEAFGDGNPFGAVAPLAEDWTHAGTRVDRDGLRAGLVRLVLEARDRDTGAFLYDAALDGETLAIDVHDERSASVRGEITFLRVAPEPPAVAWRVRVEGDLERRDDAWVIVRSRHETLEGERIR